MRLIPQKQLRGCISFTACGAFPTTLSDASASQSTFYGMWLGEEAWACVCRRGAMSVRELTSPQTPSVGICYSCGFLICISVYSVKPDLTLLTPRVPFFFFAEEKQVLQLCLNYFSDLEK